MIAHAMAAGLLPPGVVEAIDKRRRAFFWTGEDSCSDGQCKVAWDVVCSPKDGGARGALLLSSQNSSPNFTQPQLPLGPVGSVVAMAGPPVATLGTPIALIPLSGKLSSLA
jgi:hypothetical protein